MGIEPTLSAWKAEVLPLNYTRAYPLFHLILVEGEGFEPSKAEPADLQSAPFDRSGTPPQPQTRTKKAACTHTKRGFFHKPTEKSATLYLQTKFPGKKSVISFLT